jgi:hypothetical protein
MIPEWNMNLGDVVGGEMLVTAVGSCVQSKKVNQSK